MADQEPIKPFEITRDDMPSAVRIGKYRYYGPDGTLEVVRDIVIPVRPPAHPSNGLDASASMFRAASAAGGGRFGARSLPATCASLRRQALSSWGPVNDRGIASGSRPTALVPLE